MAVVPLLVSLTETYRRVFQPFARFEDFSWEARLYLRRLKNQKVLYKTCCLHLLEDAADGEDARAILPNGDHSWWKRHAVDKVSEVLAERKAACSDTIEIAEDI